MRCLPRRVDTELIERIEWLGSNSSGEMESVRAESTYLKLDERGLDPPRRSQQPAAPLRSQFASASDAAKNASRRPRLPGASRN
jgi:hypothetical protein